MVRWGEYWGDACSINISWRWTWFGVSLALPAHQLHLLGLFFLSSVIFRGRESASGLFTMTRLACALSVLSTPESYWFRTTSAVWWGCDSLKSFPCHHHVMKNEAYFNISWVQIQMKIFCLVRFFCYYFNLELSYDEIKGKSDVKTANSVRGNTYVFFDFYHD